ncbi:MAG: lysylphosphatidylglycerol synthase transmembrane domain-containing protein, partial [Acidimicrobiia bacterium]
SSPSRRRWRYLVRLAIGIAIVVVVINAIDTASLRRSLAGVSILIVLAAFVINTAASIVLPAVVTHQSNPQNHLTLIELIRVNLAVRFYSLFLPRGAATGVRWWRYRSGSRGRDAVALVVFERLMQIVAAGSVTVVAVLADLSRMHSGAGTIALVMAFVVVAAMAGISVFIFPVGAPLRRLLVRFVGRVDQTGDTGAGVISGYRAIGPRRVARIVSLSFASQLLLAIPAWMISAELGLGVGLVGVMWMRSTMDLLTLIPITVAGLGIREVGYVAFMGLYGVSRYEALAFSLVLLGIQILIGVTGGLSEAQRWLIAREGTKQPTSQSDRGGE